MDGAEARKWREVAFPLCVIAFLWLRLIDHLRVEWSVNPQYAYGWAIPFLCLYLLWQRVSQKADDIGQMAENGVQSPSKSFLHYTLLAVCALAYAPTRLIQEANPEWRLVSWALALEVVGMTLLLLLSLGPLLSGRHSAFALPVRFSQFVFPVCFFLVAVPWPTLLESPLIQGLARANTGVAVEVLGQLGVPAIQHGNTIEVGTGVVGIDEACSGIRSFQATLMISLFFGALYRLPLAHRIGLCLSGFAFSFLFNVARTTLLTFVAARSGTAAMARWHDPAGVAILVGCFVALWLLALGLVARRRSKQKAQARMDGSLRPQASGLKSQASAFRHARLCSVCILLWLVVVEAGTQLWYARLESGILRQSGWTITPPGDNLSLQAQDFSKEIRGLLRYDHAKNFKWTEDDGTRWQAMFFRWEPGRVVGHLAKQHTPEACLPAAGFQLTPLPGIRRLGPLEPPLPFRAFRLEGRDSHGFVFYCRSGDRRDNETEEDSESTRLQRLRSVWKGRGNQGMRTLEMVVLGLDDPAAAQVALARQLERLVKLEPSRTPVAKAAIQH